MTSLHGFALPDIIPNSGTTTKQAHKNTSSERPTTSAWLREMERAQMAAWFHPALPDDTLTNASSNSLTGTPQPANLPNQSAITTDLQVQRAAASMQTDRTTNDNNFAGRGIDTAPTPTSQSGMSSASTTESAPPDETRATGPEEPAQANASHNGTSHGPSNGAAAVTPNAAGKVTAAAGTKAFSNNMAVPTSGSAKFIQGATPLPTLTNVELPAPIRQTAYSATAVQAQIAAPASLSVSIPITTIPVVSDSLQPDSPQRSPRLANGDGRADPTLTSAITKSATNAGRSASLDDAVRLHAEWSDNGVTVWLGMDGDIAQLNERVALIANELRRTLSEQGQRLGTLICNGQTVYQEEEMPASRHEVTKQSEATPAHQRIVSLSSSLALNQQES